jgi:P4 family phage/plasmid primase-like protien
MTKESYQDILTDFLRFLQSKYIFLTYRDTGKLMIYTKDGVYIPAESAIVYECCQTEIFNTPNGKSIVEFNLKGNSYYDRINSAGYTCLANGVLQVTDGNIIFTPHTPKIAFESKLNIPYIPSAKCPTWENILQNILQPNDIYLIQEWFGYHFITGQPFEKAMFFVGRRSTGKSTCISVIDSLMGNCCSHSQISDFQDDKNYCIANLHGKLANTYSDMSNTVLSDIGIFKILTGSKDMITCRMPYEKPFNFINSAKLTFASNRLSPLSGQVQSDLAFWKRVLLIQFQNTIATPDINIFTKLEAELSGVLNWSLEGYKRLYSNNGIFTKNCDDIYKSWVDSAFSTNLLEDFLADKCTINKDYYISEDILYNIYLQHCATIGETAISKQEFTSSLALKGVFWGTKFNKVIGIKERIYKGIMEA